MALKDECTATLNALQTVISGSLSSGSEVLTKVLIEPTDGPVSDLPALMVFDDGLDWTAPPGQWRKVLWDLRLQILVQRGELADAQQKCRDLRADLMEVLAQHLTLSGTCQTTFWKAPPRLAKLSWGNVQFAGVDGLLVVRYDDPFTYAS